MQTHLRIPNVDCPSCLLSLKVILEDNNYVDKIDLDRIKNTFRIEYDEKEIEKNKLKKIVKDFNDEYEVEFLE